MSDTLDRLMAGRHIDPSGCWLWAKGLSTEGYGRIPIERRATYVHRAAYELLVGPIPEGHQIDHLCRVRRCFNPEHLEAVTQTENIRRGNSPNAIVAREDVCQRGHELTPDNIYIKPNDGRRQCRACIRIRSRRLDEKRRRARRQQTDPGWPDTAKELVA